MNQPSVSLVLQATRGMQWQDTSQLPAADAAFIASLQALLATIPGDAVISYNATNGDSVMLIAQQTDRTVFAVPPNVIQAPGPGPQVLTIAPESVTALAAALTPSPP